MRPARHLLLLFVLATALGGCATQGQRGPQAPSERTTVRVENRNFSEMTVYVLNGAQRVRLGIVGGMATTVMNIPDRLVFGVSSLRFEVDPLGGSRSAPSWDIAVSPGDQVRLVIPSN